MRYMFVNNATSFIGLVHDASSLGIQVLTGEGVKFPQPTGDGSDGFMITLEDRRTGQLEICRCTARSGDMLTVVRAEEGTIAQTFNIGSTVSARLTAGVIEYMRALADSIDELYTNEETDAKFVDVAGDTMLGPLNLPSGPPVSTNEAVNKSYVDNRDAVLQTAINTREPAILFGDPTQYWAGDKTWRNFSTGGGGSATGLVAIGDSPPAPAIDNQLWWQSNSGKLSIRFDSTWVQVNISPSGGPTPIPDPAIGLVSMGDTAPTTPIEGQQWWETDTGHMFVRFGGAWVQTNTSIASVTEAPLDGQAYERKSGGWAVAAAAGTGFPEAPTTGLNYLRKGSTAAWVAGLPLTGGDLTGPISATGYRTKQGLSAGFGGNWFNFAWTGARIQAWVDNYNAGDIAYTSDLGNYVPLSGGTMSGQLTVNSSIVANYVQASYCYFNANLPVGSATYVISGVNTGNGGGVLGYSGTKYGILGYNLNYSLYGNATIYTSADIQAGSTIFAAGSLSTNANLSVGGTGQITGQFTVVDFLITKRGANEPVAQSANVNMNSFGTIRAITSSIAYKTDVEPMWDEYADKILSLVPAFYRSKTKDRRGWSRFGFIAEECHDVDPRFASSDEETGKPYIHSLDAIVGGLVNLVKRLEKRISDLEASHGP